MHIILCYDSLVDECETDNGGCEQVCTNTFLSYNCSCNDGYTFSAEGRTCRGSYFTKKYEPSYKHMWFVEQILMSVRIHAMAVHRCVRILLDLIFATAVLAMS